MRRGKNIKPDFLFQFFLILSFILFFLSITQPMEKFFIVVFYVRLACLIRLGIFFLFYSHSFTVYFMFFFCVTRERVRKGIKQETAAFISAKPLHLQFNVPFCFLTIKKSETKRRAREKLHEIL